MAIITLLTDFGTHDEYAGVLKGVILSIHPSVTIVDITHHIAPQGIDPAGEVLDAAFSWFPHGTIHVAIVDPGVGSARDIIAVQQLGHIFIAPNNGLLTTVLERGAPTAVVRVENRALFLQPLSSTFHGRDIFAPVAAHLSSGMPIGELGPVLNADHIYKRPKKRCAFSVQGDIAGEISYVDRFGNLGTNIDRDSVTQLMNRSLKGVIEVEICGWHIRGLAKTYAEGEPDLLIALVNSRKRLEIAVNGGSAFKLISAGPGTAVRVTAKKNTIGPGINV